MAAATESYTLEYRLLKPKYKRGNSPFAVRIQAYCREIEKETGTTIKEDLPQRGPARFDVEGESADHIKLAVEYIQGEFVPRKKLKTTPLQKFNQAPPPPPPPSPPPPRADGGPTAQQLSNQAPPLPPPPPRADAGGPTRAVHLPPSPPPSPPVSRSPPPTPRAPSPPPRMPPPSTTSWKGLSGPRKASAVLRKDEQLWLASLNPGSPYLLSPTVLPHYYKLLGSSDVDDEHPREVHPLTTAALHRHNQLSGTCELRQFACGPCQHVWWRIVMKSKPVSRCWGGKLYRGRPACRRERYDALPRDKEYGIGRCICECERVFTSKCQATSACVCFGEDGTERNPTCGLSVKKPYIHPSFKHRQRTTTHRKHYCDECHGMGHCPNFSPVIWASLPHQSTGSTVSTFLTQMTELEENEPPYFDFSRGEVVWPTFDSEAEQSSGDESD